MKENHYPFSGCGIAGILYHNSLFDKEVAQFQHMIDSLRHRGPDGEGIWENDRIILGHRRLSIQDLSFQGKQPMTRDHFTITFNGEVYNFKEIREELEKKGIVFTSHTDTEVILHAYKLWGPDALHKFNGMYAFAIWDENEKSLFVARDRIGVKPLYYFQNANVFLFASEVQALLRFSQVPGEINWEALSQQIFFEGMYDYDRTRTLIDGVNILLPGHYMLISLDGHVCIKKYWDLPENKIEENTSRRLLIKSFQELMEDSIKLRLISDVPVATFLSGGIDSSIINALAAGKMRKDEKITAITLEYEGGGVDYITEKASEDLKYSCLVADQLKDKLRHKIVLVNPVEITLKSIDQLVDLAIIPDDIRHLSLYANYSAVRQENFKVVLNGQGADELAGGYAFSPFFKKIAGVMSISLNDLAIIEKSMPKNPRYQFLQDEVVLSGKTNFFKLYDFFHSFSGDIIERTHRFHMQTLLQWILKFEDLISMSMGIECRLPFLDYRIIEWAFRIPFNLHMQSKNEMGKILVREAATRWLPEAVVNRPKQAFPHPSEEKVSALLRRIFYEHFDEISKSTVMNKIFNIATLHQDLTQLNSRELWRIIALWRWEKKLISVLACRKQPEYNMSYMI